MAQAPARIRRSNPHRLGFALSMLLSLAAASLNGQGILTVTPTRAGATLAGTGLPGSSGDGGAAISAMLANPSAIVYDAAGNLLLADSANHVIREVSVAGLITVVAGTEGVQGFAGDSGPATAAILDTPTGLAMDAAGNLYIADSHNQRIREVSNGTISTIAGTGTSGFSGDKAAAANAQLSLPSAVAVDAGGNIYIADTNNQRIREITSGSINTIAGDGEQLFSGDGYPATSAVLDSPSGVAVDASGNVYIADRHNHRIRMIEGATISTIAGSGPPSLSGGFSGEGAAATAATLSSPRTVSIDATGNVYIADTGNQRIRELGGGPLGAASNVIATIAGSGQQGFGGDGIGPFTANLNFPRALALDSLGNLAVADTLNQLVRSATLPVLSYTGVGVGIVSSAQNVTLTNTGSAMITVASLSFTGPFVTATGGSCPAAPISLAASASCIQEIAFLPTAVGPATGAVVVSGTGIVSQTVLLLGTGVQAGTATTLSSNLAAPLLLQPITFTASVIPPGIGPPTTTVTFYDGATAISPAVSLINNTAAFTTSTLSPGIHDVTAAYSGDAIYSSSNSLVLSQPVIDFTLTLTSGSAGLTQAVQPGQMATYVFVIPPAPAPSPFPIVFSATGLPTGSTATFTPQSITLGNLAQSVTLKIQTPVDTAGTRSDGLFGGAVLALGVFLLPFTSRSRAIANRMGSRAICTFLVLGVVILASLTGCISGTRLSTNHTYNIEVVATMAGSGGAILQHTIPVTLIVQ